MPPHLHPRSRLTTSLFTTTLLASFVVVGLPHVFPCPVPRTDLADSGMLVDGEGRLIRQRRRRRRKSEANSDDVMEEGSQCLGDGQKGSEMRKLTLEEEAMILEQRARECPVPKPGGLLGELLGFQKTQSGRTARNEGWSKD